MKRSVVLTKGDAEVFRWLWMTRVMTVDQIRRVRYYDPKRKSLSHIDNVRKRLKRLSDDGYLIGDKLLDTKEKIYLLGERALEPLRHYFGIYQRRLYHFKAETLLQVYHPLMVSECAVRVFESLRDSGLCLSSLSPLHVPFYHTHTVGDATKRKHTERYITQEDIFVPGSPPFRIRPDLVFGVGKGRHRRLFFLEADRGNESSRVIAQKQIGYHHYAHSPDPLHPDLFLWQRYEDAEDFRVLFVTIDQHHIRMLERTLREQPGFPLMAFATDADIRKKQVFHDKIWRVNGDLPRSLLRPE